MRLNPVLAGMANYPFTRLNEARERVRARGVELIDFGVGEPREETPAFIRTALCEGLEPLSTYPQTEGLPELRAAIAAWLERRFGARLDPDAEVLPTLGSKEAIFHLAQVLGGDLVAVPEPAYPVYERGARFAGKEIVRLPLREDKGFLPDLDAVAPEVWDRVALLWVNYPNNPTAATAPLPFYEWAAGLARRHDFVLASDEAYSELYFGEQPPASALQVSRENVIVFNTLSKRSSMPGYRSGFTAGDPALIAALRRYRPNVGVAPPAFIQRAATAAWADEAHVRDVRETYRRKREALLPALEALGLRHAGGDATFFLWVEAGPDADALASAWLEAGVVVAPGSFFGEAAAGYLRIALVPPLDACERAVDILTRLRAARR